MAHLKPITLKIHPELSAWLPDQEPEELAQLRRNLEEEGCLDPVITWMGYIIDGHKRYGLCTELGIPFPTRELDFDTIEQVKLWMVNHQRGRRNWTDEQYAFAIAEAMKLKPAPVGRPWPESSNASEKDTENARKIEGNNSDTVTIKSISESSGIDHASLKRAAKVNAKGSAKVKKKVRDGELPLRKAAKIVDQPKSEQDRAVNTSAAMQKIELKDEVGNAVPDALVPVFDNRAKFDDALNALTRISRAMNPLMGNPRENVRGEPGGEHIERQRLQKAIVEMRSVISFARPYAICPKHTDKARCLVCGGKGWVNEQAFKTSGVK